MTSRRRAGSALLALALAGCAAPAQPSPGVGLAAPAPAVVRPSDATELAVGTAYRFPNLLPGAVDVEVTPGAPAIFPFSGPASVYLSGDAGGTTDVVTFLAADDIALFADPLHLPTPDDAVDPATQLVRVPAAELLGRLGALPFARVTTSPRPVTTAGLTGTALDIAVPELPADARSCGPDAPPCAGLLAASGGFAQSVVAGQELRIAVLDHPAGRLVIVQNLEDPRGQAVLDATRFVRHVLPAALGTATALPYGEAPLEPGRTYGVELADIGMGATFAVRGGPTLGYTRDGANVDVIAADVPPDLQAPAPFGYLAGREKLVGFVAPTADLLVPEPGVDPRTQGPAAFSRSAGEAGGLVDLLARRPWAEVVSPPADVTVGGQPGRAVEIRLRPGAGSVPCTLTRPQDGSCAVLLYSRSVLTMWLQSERVLRVAEVAVSGGPGLTVVSSTDEAGRSFADSLALVRIGP